MPYTAVKGAGVFDTPAPMSQSTLTPAGRTLHISGQTPQAEDGSTVAVGDITGQTEKVLGNIKALVEQAGGTLADVCRIVVYIVDRSDLPAVMEVRKRILPEPYPATTAIVAGGLGNREWLVEIEATAVLSDAK
jgi:enamine deaminase RidA (YjgF/YER057c/UK114 family)